MTRLSGLAGSMRRLGEAFVTVEAPELAALLASGNPGFGADVWNATQGRAVGPLIFVHDSDDPDHRWLATGAEVAIDVISVGDRLDLRGPGGQAIAAIVARAWHR